MRPRLLWLVTALAVVGCADGTGGPPTGPQPGLSASLENQDEHLPIHVPGELLVRLHPAARLAAVLQAVGGRVRGVIPQLGLARIVLEADRSVEAAVETARGLRGVYSAAPNPRLRRLFVPNDVRYPQEQWGPQQIGIEAAWGISRGSPSVVVAVLDTGIDGAHEDLLGRLVEGYDAVADAPVFPVESGDRFGHGTAVAGIIGAGLNNGLGIAGIAGEARLMPVKLFSSLGVGTEFELIRGLVFAADRGVEVINMSLGSPARSEVLQAAMDYARFRGVVLVAAAGNTGSQFTIYPAALRGVIAVGASAPGDLPTPFSTSGSHLSVLAPGVEILATLPGNRYGFVSGTSMAAPHVSGLVALLRAFHPAWTAGQVRAQLEGTAEDVAAAGFDPEAGHGRINAAAALGEPVPARYGDLIVTVEDHDLVQAIHLPHPGFTVEVRNANDRSLSKAITGSEGQIGVFDLVPDTYTAMLLDASGGVLDTTSVTVTAGQGAAVSFVRPVTVVAQYDFTAGSMLASEWTAENPVPDGATAAVMDGWIGVDNNAITADEAAWILDTAGFWSEVTDQAVQLRFRHAYVIEKTVHPGACSPLAPSVCDAEDPRIGVPFDANRLAGSTDGGVTWQDLGPAMEFGGYTFARIIQDGENVIVEGGAWFGDNTAGRALDDPALSLTQVVVDLTAYAAAGGPAPLIRWRHTSDDSCDYAGCVVDSPGDGWVIDDVTVLTIP